MASQAQCFYCFESLLASFEHLDPPPLTKVECLWEGYVKSLHSNSESQGENPGAEPLETESVVDESEYSDEEDSSKVERDHDVQDDSLSQPRASLSRLLSPPQIPSISRLQARTPSSRSSSSSTPSTRSANSSNTFLTTPASSTTSISSPVGTSDRLSNSYPLFVTWNIRSRNSGHKSLRGCIGTFDAVPLSSGLQTYALTSAFEDTRFSPVPSSLLPSLSCSITLLADFESCSTPLDWIIGTHGLRISFTYRGRRHGATYLPDVAVEQGWTKEETLESLMRKSGWDGGANGAGGIARRLLRGGRDRSDRIDGAATGSGAGQARPWEDVSHFTAIRYKGLKASATYGEWREWRRWVEENHGAIS